MVSNLNAVRQFTIPKKNGVPGGPTRELGDMNAIEDVPLESETFRKTFEPIIWTRLSPGCDKSRLKILSCRRIKNAKLRAKFKRISEVLKAEGAPVDVSYCFLMMSSNPKEITLIAEQGLYRGNMFVGDIGDPSKGVYLCEHPDLVTPAPFIEDTRLNIMTFMVLKGRSNQVGLGSFHMEPVPGYNSHVPEPCGPDISSRHDLFRRNQVLLYEQFQSGRFANVPSNVLPFAVFTILFSKFAINAKFLYETVWEGNMRIGSQFYMNLQLQSAVNLPKPPFLEAEIDITNLVSWSDCLGYSFVLELLRPPLIGELAIKKQLQFSSPGSEWKLITYYTLKAATRDERLESLHETMRVRRAAGLTFLMSGALFLMIPNGHLSALLALPFREGAVFHCLHLTKTLTESLITGTFEPFSDAENADFERGPLLQEIVDGMDPRVQEIARQLGSACTEQFPSRSSGHETEISDESPLSMGENTPKTPHPNDTPERRSPDDMDIVVDSDEETPQCWGNDQPAGVPASVVTMNTRPYGTSAFSPTHSVEGDSENRQTASVGVTPNVDATELVKKGVPSEDLSQKRIQSLEETVRDLNSVTAGTVLPPKVSRVSCINRDPRQRSRMRSSDVAAHSKSPMLTLSSLPLPKVPSTGTLSVAAQQTANNEAVKGIDLQATLDVLKSISKLPTSTLNDEGDDADQRCYSPSEAISSGGTSPASSVPDPDKTLDNSPPNVEPDSEVVESPASPTVEGRNESDDDCLVIEDSPESPPPEDGVYVASVPKIIIDGPPKKDSPEAPVTVNVYKPPNISLFPSAARNFQLSSAGVRTIMELTQGKSKQIQDKLPSIMGAREDQAKATDVGEKAKGTSNTLQTTSREQSESSANSQRVSGEGPVRKTRWDVRAPSTHAEDVDMRSASYLEKMKAGLPTAFQFPSNVPSTSSVSLVHQPSPFMSSNGDTDHRILPPPKLYDPITRRTHTPPLLQTPSISSTTSSSSVTPPSSGQTPPPQQFFGHNQSSAYHATPTPLAAVQFGRSRPPLLPYGPQSSGAARPSKFGFFSSPQTSRFPARSTGSPMPLMAQSFASTSTVTFPVPSNISPRGIVLPDDSVLLLGLITPELLRSILNCFTSWRMTSSVVWWLKIHSHVWDSIEDIAAELDETAPFARFKTIFEEFVGKGVIERMKPHFCDQRSQCTAAEYAECLSRIRRESQGCALIYLTNVRPARKQQDQLAANGVEICDVTQLKRKLGM